VATPEEKREALRRRIRDNHPAVYLTLVSIIVALALEDLFSVVRDLDTVWGSASSSWLVWFQVLGAFVAALCVWVGYCHILLTTRWILGLWDAVSVMAVLLFLFLINATVGSESPVEWFAAAALFTWGTALVLYGNLRRAKADPDLEGVVLPAPYGWTVIHALVIGAASLLFAVLTLVEAVGNAATVALTAVVSLSIAAWPVFFIYTWRRSVGLS
jgi:hypothetical protein